MRKILSIFLASVFSFQSFAAAQSYFDAVSSSKAYKDFVEQEGFSSQHIEKLSLKKTATYRCVGCYLFELRIQKTGSEEEEVVAHFETKKLWNDATNQFDSIVVKKIDMWD